MWAYFLFIRIPNTFSLLISLTDFFLGELIWKITKKKGSLNSSKVIWIIYETMRNKNDVGGVVSRFSKAFVMISNCELNKNSSICWKSLYFLSRFCLQEKNNFSKAFDLKSLKIENMRFNIF